MSTLRVDNLNARTGTTIYIPTGTKLYAPGSVVQVVNTTYSSTITFSGSAGTETSTGLNGVITPTSANSKILILASVQVRVGGSGASYGHFNIYRGTTKIYDGQSAEHVLNSAAEYGVRWSQNWLDSPASTSTQTYTIKFVIDNSTAGADINRNGSPASMTLMEIAQ